MGLVPLGVLLSLIGVAIYLFDGDIGNGGAQIAMILATAVSVSIAVSCKYCTWNDFVESMSHTVAETMVSIMIVLLIGMLSASWMASGAVPTMICYGTEILSPKFFLVTACLVCSCVSLMTGSSWSCIATIGVALLGIGNALEIPVGWTAGSIISGAYFGDKISPLSETTVLASSATKTLLYTHIRNMLYTTMPSLVIACVVFLIAGFALNSSTSISEHQELADRLSSIFDISPLTLIVPILTIVMIALHVPALATLFISSILSLIMALIMQPHFLEMLIGADGATLTDHVRQVVMIAMEGTSAQTGDSLVDNLVSTGGIAGMMSTIMLIMCAICFGASLLCSNMLQSMMEAFTGRLIRSFNNSKNPSPVRTRFTMVAASTTTGIALNLSTCDQYTSIILNGTIYQKSFESVGLENKLLSRTVEDSTTVTSVIIPWNSCGVTQSAVLGVSTLTYLPYCVFNYVSPLMTLIVAAIGEKFSFRLPSFNLLLARNTK